MHQTRNFFILALLLTISCRLPLQNTTPIENKSTEQQDKDPNIISFLVLNIHTDSNKAKNIVTLISKKETNGILKKQQKVKDKNHLSIYAYSQNKLVDSTFIAHPLYRHLEYPDDNNQFSVLDTILNNADFFVRLKGKFDEVKIYETIKNKPTLHLNTLKF